MLPLGWLSLSSFLGSLLVWAVVVVFRAFISVWVRLCFLSVALVSLALVVSPCRYLLISVNSFGLCLVDLYFISVVQAVSLLLGFPIYDFRSVKEFNFIWNFGG